jgi:uncharacterized FlgJ-related protein
MIRELMKQLFFLIFFLNLSTTRAEDLIISRSEYINSWKIAAIEQMNLYGIPACVTMAQGILESGNGNSKLAREGNNHFGIKCHDWEGDKMYLDDDAKNECFRVYSNAKESYKDHSEFLKKYKRYQFLFNYKSTDYKNWAKGLKDAGYATDSTYADKLIKLIEDEKLFELDKQNLSLENFAANQFQSLLGKHFISTTSIGTDYIVARKGDTFFKISVEVGIPMLLLRKYNDFHPNKEFLVVGEKIYIEPKARNSKKEKQFILKEQKTLREISQEKGIRLKSLLRKNNTLTPDQHLPKGTKVFLK